MAEFALTQKAIEDLNKIWNYTYYNWSEAQADKYYFLLVSACKSIAAKPSIGKEYISVRKGLRGYPAGRHIIFYRASKAGRTEIIRILHARMDLKSKF